MCSRVVESFSLPMRSINNLGMESQSRLNLKQSSSSFDMYVRFPFLLRMITVYVWKLACYKYKCARAKQKCPKIHVSFFFLKEKKWKNKKRMSFEISPFLQATKLYSDACVCSSDIINWYFRPEVFFCVYVLFAPIKWKWDIDISQWIYHPK